MLREGQEHGGLEEFRSRRKLRNVMEEEVGAGRRNTLFYRRKQGQGGVKRSRRQKERRRVMSVKSGAGRSRIISVLYDKAGARGSIDRGCKRKQEQN